MLDLLILFNDQLLLLLHLLFLLALHYRQSIWVQGWIVGVQVFPVQSVKNGHLHNVVVQQSVFESEDVFGVVPDVDPDLDISVWVMQTGLESGRAAENVIEALEVVNDQV